MTLLFMTDLQSTASVRPLRGNVTTKIGPLALLVNIQTKINVKHAVMVCFGNVLEKQC